MGLFDSSDDSTGTFDDDPNGGGDTDELRERAKQEAESTQSKKTRAKQEAEEILQIINSKEDTQ